MPSLPDTAVIIFLGLLLFGPKGLAQIARQLGKLMGEFRRASNEFRMQMEEELRIAEQADRQKQIAAVEAAAPVPPVVASPRAAEMVESDSELPPAAPIIQHEPLPIATSGDLSIMPPATGLPSPRSASVGSLIDSVPKGDPSEIATAAETSHLAEDQRPMRYTNGHAHHNPDHLAGPEPSHGALTEESLHG